MSYKEQLHNATNDNQPATPTRSEEIIQDVKDIFNDDTVFGQMISDSVGEALGNLTAKAVETVNEAVNQTLRSEEFNTRLGDQLGWKDTERQAVNTNVQEEQKEMG